MRGACAWPRRGRRRPCDLPPSFVDHSLTGHGPRAGVHRRRRQGAPWPPRRPPRVHCLTLALPPRSPLSLSSRCPHALLTVPAMVEGPPARPHHRLQEIGDQGAQGGAGAHGPVHGPVRAADAAGGGRPLQGARWPAWTHRLAPLHASHPGMPPSPPLGSFSWRARSPRQSRYVTCYGRTSLAHNTSPISPTHPPAI